MADSTAESSLLILADGRVLVRNLTSKVAAALLAVQPGHPELAGRAGEPGPGAVRTPEPLDESLNHEI